jgi:hypothetical protein
MKKFEEAASKVGEMAVSTWALNRLIQAANRELGEK